MPNKKSAEKELRKTKKRNLANKRVSQKFKSLIKDNLKKIKTGDKQVKEDFKQTVKSLDKAVKKGILKKNTASRKKSRLALKINAIK